MKAAGFGMVAVACQDRGNSTSFGRRVGRLRRASARTPDTKRIPAYLDDPLDSFGLDDLAITLV